MLLAIRAGGSEVLMVGAGGPEILVVEVLGPEVGVLSPLVPLLSTPGLEEDGERRSTI